MKSVNANQAPSKDDEIVLFTAKGYAHGGKRAGAGRPKTSTREPHSIRCTREEWTAIQNLLRRMRGENNDETPQSF